VREEAGAAGALAVAEADTGVTLLRLHLGEQEGDLGQRLLPAREHLGVADRRLQRQDDERQLNPFDAIGARLAGSEAGGQRVGGNGTSRHRKSPARIRC
jgi:hypothetical protein